MSMSSDRNYVKYEWADVEEATLKISIASFHCLKSFCSDVDEEKKAYITTEMTGAKKPVFGTTSQKKVREYKRGNRTQLWFDWGFHRNLFEYPEKCPPQNFTVSFTLHECGGSAEERQMKNLEDKSGAVEAAGKAALDLGVYSPSMANQWVDVNEVPLKNSAGNTIGNLRLKMCILVREKPAFFRQFEPHVPRVHDKPNLKAKNFEKRLLVGVEKIDISSTRAAEVNPYDSVTMLPSYMERWQDRQKEASVEILSPEATFTPVISRRAQNLKPRKTFLKRMEEDIDDKDWRISTLRRRIRKEQAEKDRLNWKKYR